MSYLTTLRGLFGKRKKVEMKTMADKKNFVL